MGFFKFIYLFYDTVFIVFLHLYLMYWYPAEQSFHFSEWYMTSGLSQYVSQSN